ncbi:MAG: hypothetical protein IID32_03320 [Planctomycetes bacterium]|nr:hypothetical protein [Planctomycetota bacterium]
MREHLDQSRGFAKRQIRELPLDAEIDLIEDFEWDGLGRLSLTDGDQILINQSYQLTWV